MYYPEYVYIYISHVYVSHYIYIYIHPHFIPIIVGCIQTLHIHIVDAPFYHYIIISYYVYFISMSNHPEVDRLEYVFLDFLHGHSHFVKDMWNIPYPIYSRMTISYIYIPMIHPHKCGKQIPWPFKHHPHKCGLWNSLKFWILDDTGIPLEMGW